MNFGEAIRRGRQPISLRHETAELPMTDTTQPNTTAPIPTIGRIVHYCLSQNDVSVISQGRISRGIVGNTPHEGHVFPMMIVAAWGDQPDSYVNGQVFLDGHDTLWVTSVQVGTGPRTFSWPVVR